jgi:2,4-dienoyl-CoA reductase-like NADH-dependent reductase (Old Yellow Enzyme family)
MSNCRTHIVIRGNTIKKPERYEPMRTFLSTGTTAPSYGTALIEHYTARAKRRRRPLLVEATPVSAPSNKTQMWKVRIRALGQIAANSNAYGAAVMMQLVAADCRGVNGMTASEIHAMQKECGKPPAANEMGFDGVEYHFAHGRPCANSRPL